MAKESFKSFVIRKLPEILSADFSNCTKIAFVSAIGCLFATPFENIKIFKISSFIHIEQFQKIPSIVPDFVVLAKVLFLVGAISHVIGDRYPTLCMSTSEEKLARGLTRRPMEKK